MPDVSLSGIGKAVGIVARPLFQVVRQQWGRQGAGALETSGPATVDQELNEAISVLLGQGATLPEHVWVWIKGLLSDPPALFAEPDAKEWLRREDVQATLKDAALALATDHPIDAHLAEAKRLYGLSAGDADWYGEPLFIYAVSFLSLSLKAKISADTRLLLEAGNRHARHFEGRLDEVQHTVAEASKRLAQLVDRQDAPVAMPVDAIDRFIETELSIRERGRAIAHPDRVSDATTFGMRAFDGDLRSAGNSIKSALFRYVAATQAREGSADAAEIWIDRAAHVGANDLQPDRARIALARKDWDRAIALLDKRTDRLATSLRIDAVQRRDDKVRAIAYFQDFVAPADVTGHLLSSVAHWLVEVGRIEDAEPLLDAATPEQLEENPLLHFTRMRVRLALCAGPNQRTAIMRAPGLLPHPSTLRNDEEGARLRRQALADLRELLPILRQLRQPDFVALVDFCEQYLALASLDPLTVGQAKATLKTRLEDPETVVAFSPLAKLFGVEFDRTSLRSQLDRSARLGPWDDAQLRAALDLAVHDRDPDSLVGFIDAHRARLIESSGPGQVIGLQVEALSRAGRIVDARAKLDGAASILTATETQLLNDIIAECEGEPTLDLHLARFAASDDERDLVLLVDALIDSKDRRVADFAAQLWRRRHRVEDAVNSANGFVHFGRDLELEQFLEELGSTVALDERLQAHRAWMLYRRGDLPAATELLTTFRVKKPNDPGLRQLEINIAIEYGDWHRLAPLIRGDLDHADERSAIQLLQAAGLAHAANNPDVMPLLRAAVAKAPDDPTILLNAYDIAVRRGVDTTDEVSGWLLHAIARSDENGPIQSKRFSDIVALRAENMHRATELDGLIMSGRVTLGAVAKPLGTTLSALVLDRLRANSRLTDPRRRLFLPFFAGNRTAFDLKGVNRIALDPSAILILHLLGLLDKTFAAFEKVIIPAGTLPALFEDLRRADRGQPSRAARATQIKRLAAEHIFETLNDIDAENDADDVDVLFAASEQLDGYLVHTPPLYVAGTMLEEARDASSFASRLVSPASILAALLQRGEIAQGDVNRAKRFNGFTEQWPSEPPIAFDRPLILDGVAAQHLVDADLIQPLRRIGAKLHIRQQVLAFADLEIDERDSIQRLSDEIEAVRVSLNRALSQDKARIGPSHRDGALQADEGEDEDDHNPDPLRAVLRDAGGAEVLISDERMVNRFGHFTDASGTDRPIATSLDVIDVLVARNAIAPAARAEALQFLRSSGVGLIPVSAEQIVAAAQRGDWSIGPGRELKAIRDSIHLALLRRAVQLPDERHWLESITMQFGLAIKRCFRDLDKVEDAEAAAEFLFSSAPDLRGYIQHDPSPDAQTWAQAVILGFHSLIASPLDVPFDRIDTYHRWYERSVFERLRGRDHDLCEALFGRLRDMLLTDRTHLDLDVPEGAPAPTREQIARWMLGHLPDLITDRLLEEPAIRVAIGHRPPDLLKIEGALVSQAALIAFLRSASMDQPQPLLDATGAVIAETATINADGTATITHGAKRLRFESAGLLVHDREIRMTALKALLSSRTLGPVAERDWIGRVEAGPLNTDEFIALTKAASATWESFFEEAQDNLTGENFKLPDIVPLDELYFRTLFEPGPADEPLDAMMQGFVASRAGAVDPLTAAIAAAPLAIAPNFYLNDLVPDFLSSAKVADLARALIELGDLFSLLAAFQLICCHLDHLECRTLGDELIEKLWGEEKEIRPRAHDFCAGAMLSLAVARWRGQLSGWSLHGRRLVLLVHAGHISRVLRLFEVQRPQLLEQVRDEVGVHYQLAGLMERGEAIEWQYPWLTPDVIEAYLLRRFDQVLDTLPETQRPPEWIATMTSVVKTYEEGPQRMLLGLPGPLDQFSSSGQSRDVMPAEGYADLLNMLGNTEPTSAINLLFIVMMTFTRPEDIDMAPLINVMERQLGAIDPEHEDQGIDVALMLAAKWRAPDIAEGVFALVRKQDRPMRQIVEWAVAAAAAHADSAERTAALADYITQLAFAVTDARRAGHLVRAIEAVTNCDPSLALALSRGRISALLAM